MKPDFIIASLQNILFFTRNLTDSYKNEFFRPPTNIQNLILLKMSNSENYILDTTRQVGKTTLSLIFAAHQAMNGRSVAYFSSKEAGSEQAWRILNDLFKNSKYRTYLTVKTKRSLSFLGGGEIEFIPITSNKYDGCRRGKSFDIVIADEVSFFEDSKEFICSVFPIISSRKYGKIVLTGTGFENNGLDLDEFKKSNHWTVDQLGWENFKTQEFIDEVSRLLNTEQMRIEFPSQKDFK